MKSAFTAGKVGQPLAAFQARHMRVRVAHRSAELLLSQARATAAVLQQVAKGYVGIRSKV